MGGPLWTSASSSDGRGQELLAQVLWEHSASCWRHGAGGGVLAWILFPWEEVFPWRVVSEAVGSRTILGHRDFPGQRVTRHQVQPWQGLGIKSPAPSHPTDLSRFVSLVGARVQVSGSVVGGLCRGPPGRRQPPPNPSGHAPSPGMV